MTRAEGLPLQVKGSIVGSRSRSFRGIDRWLCDLVLVVHKDALVLATDYRLSPLRLQGGRFIEEDGRCLENA